MVLVVLLLRMRLTEDRKSEEGGSDSGGGRRYYSGRIRLIKWWSVYEKICGSVRKNNIN